MLTLPRRTDHQNVLLGTPLSAGPTAGSANTKGSWVELVSSTTRLASGLRLIITKVGGTTSNDGLLDIGFGGSGSEVVKVANIPVATAASSSTVLASLEVVIPIQIPAGTRIATRFQDTISSLQVYVVGQLLIGPMETCAVFTTLGANTADSGGAGLTIGGTANVKSAYVELTSGLTRPTSKLLVFVGLQANTTPSTASWKVDIATGGSGSETVIIEDFVFILGDTAGDVCPRYYSFDVDIPANTRIAVRASSSITITGDRLIDIIAIAGSPGPVV